MAKIMTKKRMEANIPTTSTGDIAFLLLLFFMVSTVFVQERVFWVERNNFPYATRNVERILRNESATIYITKDEKVYIDDFPRSVDDGSIVSAMRTKKTELTSGMEVCFRTHRETRYEIMRSVMMLLQDADTRNIAFEIQRPNN